MTEDFDNMKLYRGKAYIPFMENHLKNYEFLKDIKDQDDNSYTRKGIFYRVNKFGYRGDSFSNNVDLLVLGCSNTFGLGVPEEYSWPSLLKSEKIKSVNSLASCGDSAMGQVIKFFQYVKEFGNPKNVVAVFPAYRAEFPLEKGKWEISDKEKTFTIIKDSKASVTLPDPEDRHFEKYSASPYDPNNILTKQQTRYYTHTFINMMEVYCENFNINFKYTIYEWDYRFRDIRRPGESLSEYMSEYSKNYFEYEYPLPTFILSEEETGMDCHKEYNKDQYFYRADDYVENKSSGHWGLHHHIHIAEAVQKALFGE